ncbi:hypothetical protein [Microcoleus sp. Pol17_C1]|uniref:hypothetical protein n=1 Tax=unclassified Microcoleus TaxID=2642155 RepID=UPI002FD5014B
MNANKKQSHKSIFVFALGMLGVFLLSLTLRFWELERFNTLVEEGRQLTVDCWLLFIASPMPDARIGFISN